VSIIHGSVKKALSALGYELRRSSDPYVRFSNFENLSMAYEQHLEEQNLGLSVNRLRPKLMARLLGTPPSEAYHIVQALAQCRHLHGDVCEFGVAQGETSALIANEILADNKTLHLFDSFAGLSAPTGKDELKDDIYALGNMSSYAGVMSYPEKLVRRRLRDVAFPAHRCVIHKGFIEQVLQQDHNLPRQVSFAYVDFDLYDPIRVALDFLHEITPAGAIIIVDDYDYFSTGVKLAVQEFLHAKNGGSIFYDCHVPDIRYGHFAVLTKKQL
jgi:O-methyltransferase